MYELVFILSAVTVFLIPFRNAINIGPIGSVGRTAGLLFVLFWAVYFITTQRSLKLPTFLVYAYFLLILSFISVAWSINIPQSINNTIRLLSVILLITATWHIYNTTEKVLIGIQTLVFGGYIALFGTYYVYIQNITDLYFRHAAFGYMVNRMGGILALMIPAALILVKYEGYGNRYLNWFNLLYVPLGVIGVLITGSRAAFVALLPTSLLVLYYMKDGIDVKSTIYITVFPSLIAALGILLNIFSADRIAYLLSISNAVMSGDIGPRGEIWVAGLRALPEAFFFGHGSGTYRYVVEPYLGGQVSAHNSFMTIVVELGIIGLFIYLLLFVTAVRAALRTNNSGVWITFLAVWIILSMTNTWQLSALAWIMFIFLIRCGVELK